MIESPLLDELREEWTAQARVEAMAEMLLTQLGERFGAVPEEVEQAVRGIRSRESLDLLARSVLHCDSLEAFRARLATVSP